MSATGHSLFVYLLSCLIVVAASAVAKAPGAAASVSSLHKISG